MLKSGTLNADLVSDHCLIYCTLRVNKCHDISKYVTYRDFKKFIYADFYADLIQVKWDTILYISDINDKIKFLNSYILQLFDKHAPVKTAYISKPYAPWLTPTIKIMMRERNKLLSKYKRTEKLEAWVQYKQFRNS